MTRKRYVLTTLMILILLLSSCTSNDAASPNAYQICEYLSQTNLEINELLDYSVGKTDVGILGISNISNEPQLYIFSLEDMSIQVASTNLPNTTISISIDSLGNLWYGHSENDDFIITSLSEGSEPYIFKSGKNITDIEFCSDGSVIAIEKNKVYIHETNGNLFSIDTDQTLDRLIRSNDWVVYTQPRANKATHGYLLCSINEAKNALEPVPAMISGENAINEAFLFSGCETDSLLMPKPNSAGYKYMTDSGGIIYSVDPADGTFSPLFDTTAIPLSGELVGLWSHGEIDYLLLDTELDGIQLVSQQRTDSIKQTLTIARCENNSYVSMAIEKFNRSSVQYYMQSKIYSSDYELHMDLISGVYPDIINVYGFNYETLANKGVLTDLYPLIENDPNLSLKDLNESVVKALEWGTDVLYRISPEYSLYFITANPEIVSDIDKWTLDDMQRILIEHPDMTLFPSMSALDTMQTLLQFNWSTYYSKEKNRFEFDGAKFKEFLAFCKEISARPDDYEYNPWIEGSALAGVAQISDFREFALCIDFKCVGFPTDEGSGVAIQCMEQFSICKYGTNSYGAWSFITWILDEESQDNTQWLPLRISSLNKVATAAMLDNSEVQNVYQNPVSSAVDDTSLSSQVTIEYKGLTQEQIDAAKKLVLSADRIRVNIYDDIRYQIVSEEVQAYFDNKKTVDEVVKVIQNRIDIYTIESSE